MSGFWRGERHVTGRRSLLRSPLLCGALVLSVAAILAFTIPWDSWQDHSHWSRVEWIPFRTHYGTWLERLLNVALFVPLGATLRVWGRRVWVCALLGGLLSVAVELSQVYSHGRLPTATDVAFNTIGTIVGAGLAGRWTPVARVAICLLGRLGMGAGRSGGTSGIDSGD